MVSKRIYSLLFLFCFLLLANFAVGQDFWNDMMTKGSFSLGSDKVRNWGEIIQYYKSILVYAIGYGRPRGQWGRRRRFIRSIGRTFWWKKTMNERNWQF
jgi:hypothetical protein